jgi:hypothetical protein
VHVRDKRAPSGRGTLRSGPRERALRALAELPELYHDCESLLVRFPPAFAQRVAGGGSAGLFLDERVTDARRDIVAMLASWSGLVADERGVTRPGRRDVTELSRFLAVHADWLLAHQVGSCFAEELLAVAASAREVSQGVPSRDIELGRCVERGCDNTMTAIRGADGRSSSVEVRCAAGHVWQARQWLQLARQLRGRSGVLA